MIVATEGTKYYVLNRAYAGKSSLDLAAILHSNKRFALTSSSTTLGYKAGQFKPEDPSQLFK